MIVELLAAEVPEKLYRTDSELEHWKQALGVGRPRFAARSQPARDISHPAMAVNLDACIQCTRCVRACREEQVNDVIGFALRGAHAKIVFDLDDPMGNSTCVACGECVQACPTGALAPAKEAYLAPTDRTVSSLCPYCGVGCQLTYHVKDNEIVRVEGRDGPANHDRLCVKGRFGFDYVHHPQRLTRPLIRKKGVPKDPEGRDGSGQSAGSVPRGELGGGAGAGGRHAAAYPRRPWAERAGRASARPRARTRRPICSRNSCATGFGTNNVDHCTRLCHASSVAALLEGIGSGAVSNPVMDVLQAEVVLLIGANPVVNHPVAATWIKNAVKNGTKLILADPRRSELARHADALPAIQARHDVAMLNAMMHTIVEEGLVAESFIADRTLGYDELKANVAAYSPEAMAPVCGIPAQTIREVARLFATSKGSMILWGMGISQHVHGYGQRALPDRADDDDRPGGPSRHGLHPLRGQNNVQGASDVGLIPMMFPDYQRVDNAAARTKFEALWGQTLDPKPGLTVVEIMDAVHAGKIRGMYIMGENPAMSDPDVAHARQALSELENAGGAGYFPDRDRLSRRCDSPGVGVSGKDGNVHQHRPFRATRAAGARAAGRGPARPAHHQRHGA
jgi:formate dehydrogenase major subunit